ncbi:DUF4232 domain-containing protein [Leifsonia sp. ZF2019]|uniref:DUF4232 domain-containing protein n=1 Tax=Leifsonia sp. ZF2019 TaxID=2781978 RepID=UPI001CBC948F|nr:DUF4232 domain-containing protein [Leifsonia sp. ZF2019]UAJ80054.1 DUF4232 domain-containing protein [Leifsonia sp. ZF2019]
MFAIANKRMVAGLAAGIAAAGAVVAALAIGNAATAMPAENPGCANTEVSITAGDANGAAGTLRVPLTITNTGSVTCSIAGALQVRGVVYGAGEHMVGRPATATSEALERVTVLKPRQSAVATLQITDGANFPGESVPVDGFNVSLPSDRGNPSFIRFVASAPRTGSWLRIEELQQTK